ncbi:MAG: geranylgeranyl reductase family protein [Candidatus Aenigmarchaeota archaeon]|nr:geranylgeranyl reductase family protein [Candidatus Aenigmarchaeota archaeon]
MQSVILVVAMGYDAIIVGGGPAGSIAAMYLKRAGKKVLLVDKAKFPRDKVCGDAQGRKLATVMKDLGIYDDYRKLPGHPIFGLRLSSPNGVQIDMDLIDRATGTPGYIVRRMDLDHFLFSKAKKFGVQTLERTAVEEVLFSPEGSITGLQCRHLDTKQETTLTATVYLAADGADSVFAKKLGIKNPPEHFIVALRAYYKNVEGMGDLIEIHLLKKILPGYFWIFPLPNKEANVGIGMVIKDKNDKNINLVDELKAAIASNPLFTERFKGAELVGGIKAWNLPVASYRRPCTGPNYLLLGDAASLIDPLSGEGVGTAAISAKHAAATALQAMEKGPSRDLLAAYEQALWAEIGEEIKADYRIQRLGHRFPFLLNKLMSKAAKNQEFRKKFEAMLPYTEGKERIGAWRFVASLFF